MTDEVSLHVFVAGRVFIKYLLVSLTLHRCKHVTVCILRTLLCL